MCTAYVGGGAATGYYASKSKNKKALEEASPTRGVLGGLTMISPKKSAAKASEGSVYRDFTRNTGY